MNDLAAKHCSPQHGAALSEGDAATLLTQVPRWTMQSGAKQIHRTFAFQDYYSAMAFVNAVAWIVHREDHHPDMAVGYNKVMVAFSTHSVGGLSENDFICAARIDLLGAA